MARVVRRMAALLDAHVVDRSRLTEQLTRHRVQRLEPAVARHGGRLIRLTSDSAQAEFPDAAEALGAAIEFQQAMTDANRGLSETTAVVFRLDLHLANAGEGNPAGTAHWPEEQGSGIVVSAPLRDALGGRVRASFAELGRTGLGTVERPVHLYEVGWDPADWPDASAAAAVPLPARGERNQPSRWAVAIAWSVLLWLTGMLYLVAPPPPQPAPAEGDAPRVENVDRVPLERQAEAAFARWQREEEQNGGEQDGTDGAPANLDNARTVDAYDGLYSGTATMRADGRSVAFKVQVTEGIGSGTLSRLDCGTVPISFRVSPSGEVRGMALIFGSTCLKAEQAIRGRAIGGTLQLRLGGQYLELSKPEN